MFDVATVRIRGPLSGLVAGLAEHLAGRGYRDNTVRFLAEVFARLSRWLHDERLGLDDLDWLVVDGFLDWSHARGYRSPVSRRGMVPLVEFLVAGGVVRAGRFAGAAPVPGSPEDVAGRFISYRDHYIPSSRPKNPATVVPRSISVVPTARHSASEWRWIGSSLACKKYDILRNERFEVLS